ncbi:MAG: glycogen/starch synthase, partial [Planctomycetes bacterium]|nr:glycogen/starch synthase [Planctomycetota bacterium]
MRPLRLALAASELTPFAKTGGLADVLLGLGRWLGKPAVEQGATPPEHGPGHDVRLFVPYYKRIADSGVETVDLPRGQKIDVRFPERTIRFGIKEAKLPQSDVSVYF